MLNQGSVNLQLDLRSINYPSKYNVLFYTAESFKSNEVRQFTSWVDYSLRPSSTNNYIAKQYNDKGGRRTADSS